MSNIWTTPENGKVFKERVACGIMSQWVRWDDERDYDAEEEYEPSYSTDREYVPEEGRGTKFCQRCGARIHVDAEICPNCGVRATHVRSTVQKSPGLAAVLSFLFIGLGQIYNGQIGKGLLFIVAGIILTFTVFIIIGIIFLPIFWVYNIYDAYNTAKKINAGEIVV